MRTIRLATLVSVLFIALSAQAGVVFRINFDLTPQAGGPAPNPYPGGPGDVLAGSTNQLSPNGGSDGQIYIVASTGRQGGGAILHNRGTMWPNRQGYMFGNLPTTVTPTIPAFVANEWTLEALVKPDFTNTGFGLGYATILNSEHLADGVNQGDIRLHIDQNTGIVHFDEGTLLSLASVTALTPGQWYHIAAVVRPNWAGTQQVELWIDGVIDNTAVYPATWETQAVIMIPGYFNIGGWYWAGQRNWMGEIDALAIDDTALDAGSFHFRPPPRGTLILVQ